MLTSELFQEELIAELDKILTGYVLSISPLNGFEIWATTEEGCRYSVYFDCECVQLRHYSFHDPSSGCQCPQRRDDLHYADPATHPEAVARIIAEDLANTKSFTEVLEMWNAGHN